MPRRLPNPQPTLAAKRPRASCEAPPDGNSLSWPWPPHKRHQKARRRTASILWAPGRRLRGPTARAVRCLEDMPRSAAAARARHCTLEWHMPNPHWQVPVHGTGHRKPPEVVSQGLPAQVRSLPPAFHMPMSHSPPPETGMPCRQCCWVALPRCLSSGVHQATPACPWPMQCWTMPCHRKCQPKSVPALLTTSPQATACARWLK
mmetsp:Transcript_162321/g.515709  ORF Transcript_162321/g.515709 Transcript_162321/m.515709 type:complete len:204 (-) Transcript_162321:1895-2506(-)